MNSVTLDIIIIFALILANGFFSGSEIAIISLRRGRIRSLLEKGDRRAQMVHQIQSNPDTFFATVQIGVTLVGSFASAFGGASLLPHVAPIIASIPVPYISNIAEEISLVLLVVAISYLSLVFGELVPKSLAYRHAEKYALLVAYPLNFFSRIFTFFTKFLTFSSNIVLRPFKDRTSFSETRLLVDEVRHLLEEGVKAGTIARREHEIIDNVLEFNETAAREIMVPRVEIKAVPVDASEEEILKILEIPYSRLPVYNESLDHIVGILHTKDLIRAVARKEKLSLADMCWPAYYVPESMKIDKILQELQKRKTHLAVVVDEYGGTAGLLTLEDILEEIVGEIEDIAQRPDEKDIMSMPDGSYMVSGSVSISDFNEFFQTTLPESESYTSLAGFIIEQTGRFPEVGEKIIWEAMSFELVKRIRQKMVHFRVRKLPRSERKQPA